MLAVPNIILQQCSDQIQSKQLRCVHMKHSNKNSASHPALIPLAPWAPSPNQEPRHAKQEFESNMFSFRMGFWEFRHLIMRLWTSSMTVHPRFNSVLFNKVLPTTRRQKKTINPPCLETMLPLFSPSFMTRSWGKLTPQDFIKRSSKWQAAWWKKSWCSCEANYVIRIFMKPWSSLSPPNLIRGIGELRCASVRWSLGLW